MPLPTTTQYPRQNTPKRKGPAPLSKADLGRDQLSKLMSDYGVNDDEADIPELLGRLEAAHGVANGVEGKLDDILQNLDSLLESMDQNIIPPIPRPGMGANSEVVKT